MQALREEHRAGLDYLEAATALLQRVRRAHPVKGLYEAADLQWWWSVPRRTDPLDQLFWFDESGRAEAAAVLVDFGSGSLGSSRLFDEVTFCPLFMPDPDPELVAHVVERGLAHAAKQGFTSVELEVDQADIVMREVLAGHGLTIQDQDALTEAWVSAAARSEVSPLHEGYRLASRAETLHRTHHVNERNPAFVEERLHQTSLYRPDLDLLVLDSDDNLAAYGLFWFDLETATGLVEPMRTKDEHQRRGLARHVLTSGLERLAEAGAERIKIGFEPANPASGHLYRSVGFEPVKTTDLFTGPTTAGES